VPSFSRSWLFLLCLAAADAAAQSSAHSPERYPDRSIRFVVPQAAGSATDDVARLVAPGLARDGTSVVVDNRPGGALTIGIDAVAKSPPDGYTIGMGPVGALAI
jgi:tripartite-type tricarboxylate transporter receptor subunit TctC